MQCFFFFFVVIKIGCLSTCSYYFLTSYFFFAVLFLSLHVTDPFPVRLTGGPNLCAGRVELFHQGEWGTVCDDDWDMRDAAVVCRELDCGEALSAPHGAWFGEGAGPIWLNELRCAGTEWHLHSCRHLGFRKHVCTHEEDASAICSEQHFPPFTASPPHTTHRRGKIEAVTTAKPLVSPTPAQGAPALRLVGGRSHCSGRVEVFHEGQWGTVCDDMWDLLDVAVVCRELDCGEALAAPGGAFFGEGNSVIWLDDVQCQGEEPALVQCHTSPWGTNNCRHGEDAGAVCSGEMPLAMVEERVAMLTRTLAPHRLRSVAPKRIPRPTQPSRRQEEPVANEVPHAEKRPKEHHSEDMLGDRWQIRLEGGPGSCAGRVEVLYKDQWGTVCDDGWDLVDAAVVCRELGCGAPLLSPGNARYGPGSGPIWLDDVNCTGSEFTLRRCRSQPWGKHNCNHHEDASVICTGKWKRLSLPKLSRDSATTTTASTTTTTTTTTTPTTQGPRPADGPGLQSTLDVPETTRAIWNFPNEWETGTLQPLDHDEPLGVTQNVELELEHNTKPTSSMDIVETAHNPEILLPMQEIDSTDIPRKRTTTYKWLQETADETMPNPQILQYVQEMSSTNHPKTKPYTNDWEQEPTHASTESQPSSTMLDLESKRETETTTRWGMDKTIANLEILQNSEEMESTNSPKSTTSLHKWEQKLIHATTESQPSSTMLDLESEKEATTTAHRTMDRSIPDLEILKNGQEMESNSSPKTRPTLHKWGQKSTSSTEFLPPLVTGDLESEREAESTSPSEMELPTVTQTVKPATDMVPPIHWSNMPEVSHITQDVEFISTVMEVQPTTAMWIQDLAKDREATDNVAKELVLSSKNLEATMKMELPTTTETMHPIMYMEKDYPKIPADSGEDTSQKQQESSNINPHTIQPIESTFTLSDVSSLDETDVHNTTEWLRSPVPHTVLAYGQSEDGLVNSGDTESGTSYTDTILASALPKAPGPNISSAETVINPAKLRKSSPGCPVRQEPQEEHHNFCSSSLALGNLVQAMEGLRGDLGSLSTTIQHQGSQLEAIAHSLTELAASVRHLVRALPIPGQQASVQSSSVPHRQDEDQLQNQLPLK
ncbi:soluble scavenger receptor cysteine-rich domain-containing protein SSC5D-like [Sceloporus undulatus]|uniref:soluble scavenger receptor cysteine-rich domain-containing protein SSC5D-like n=1 Tax=Sceloporus undulatus TaxID=8520 RepID=UPI001C4D4BE5|nr:soluble scavenger receptor cysteine-rich domain-containing protein SSC5D-like [Sceloporus undulatus]